MRDKEYDTPPSPPAPCLSMPQYLNVDLLRRIARECRAQSRQRPLLQESFHLFSKNPVLGLVPAAEE